MSKLDKSKQSASDAPCQAAKQFLHEVPYEQVRQQPLFGPFHIMAFLHHAAAKLCKRF